MILYDFIKLIKHMWIENICFLAGEHCFEAFHICSMFIIVMKQPFLCLCELNGYICMFLLLYMNENAAFRDNFTCQTDGLRQYTHYY